MLQFSFGKILHIFLVFCRKQSTEYQHSLYELMLYSKIWFSSFLTVTWLQCVEIGRPNCGGFQTVINDCATDLLNGSKLQLSVSNLLYTTYVLQRERSSRPKKYGATIFSILGRCHTESKAYQFCELLPYMYYSRKQLLDMAWTAHYHLYFYVVH